MRNRKLLWLLAGIVVLAGVHFWIFGSRVTCRATLGGEVSSTVAAGTVVREGDVLLRVRSLTGEAVSARARVSGTVLEVKVKPGTAVAPGTEIAVIREK